MKFHKLERKAAHVKKQELVFDVVCGMELVQKDVRHITHYDGIPYYFCSNHCKQHFDDTPTRYVWGR